MSEYIPDPDMEIIWRRYVPEGGIPVSRITDHEQAVSDLLRLWRRVAHLERMAKLVTPDQAELERLRLEVSAWRTRFPRGVGIKQPDQIGEQL